MKILKIILPALFLFSLSANIEAQPPADQRGLEVAKKAEQADVVMFLFDASTYTAEQLKSEISELKSNRKNLEDRLILVANKTDKTSEIVEEKFEGFKAVSISAKENENLHVNFLRSPGCDFGTKWQPTAIIFCTSQTGGHFRLDLLSQSQLVGHV